MSWARGLSTLDAKQPRHPHHGRSAPEQAGYCGSSSLDTIQMTGFTLLLPIQHHCKQAPAMCQQGPQEASLQGPQEASMQAGSWHVPAGTPRSSAHWGSCSRACAAERRVLKPTAGWLRQGQQPGSRSLWSGSCCTWRSTTTCRGAQVGRSYQGACDVAAALPGVGDAMCVQHHNMLRRTGQLGLPWV